MRKAILIGSSIALGYFLNSTTGKRLISWTKEKLEKIIDDFIIKDTAREQSEKPEEN